MQHRIEPIDCQYILSEFAGVYLLISDSDLSRAEVAIIEANTSKSAPLIRRRLEELGLKESQVKAVVVTHAHLDHAGGVGVLMRDYPQATLYAHPRAARHLIDPTKLVSSARAVYGEHRFDALYGEILPVEASRVKEVEDLERVRFGRGEWIFLHVRGHANHHLALIDPQAGAVFTGDAFGMAYPALLRKAGKLFLLPSTSPTDFDADAAKDSVDRIVEVAREFGCTHACLTHFGKVEDLEEGARQLKLDLSFAEELQREWVKSENQGEAADQRVRDRLIRYYEDRVSNEKLGFGPDEWKVLALDLELNAQGIIWSAKKQAQTITQKRH